MRKEIMGVSERIGGMLTGGQNAAVRKKLWSFTVAPVIRSSRYVKFCFAAEGMRVEGQGAAKGGGRGGYDTFLRE